MPTQQMFSPQFPSPALAPDLLRQQYQTQQAQQYAQALLQDGQQIPQGQMVSGHYVAPSWAQYMGQALKSYVGRKIADQIPDRLANMQRDQQNYSASLFGLNPTPQQLGAALRNDGQAGQASAQTFPVGPSGTPQQPPVQQPQQPSQQPVPQPSGGYTGSMPLLPGRTPEQSFQAYSLLGPQEYMKQVAQQEAPTDFQKIVLAQGLRPGTPEYNQALAAYENKQTYIAPINLRSGSTLLDPKTNRPLFSVPENGIQTTYDSQGHPTATVVPGYGGAQAGIAGSKAQATAEGSAAGQKIGEMRGSIESGERKQQAIQGGAAMSASFASLDRMKQTASAIISSPGFNGISGFGSDVLKSFLPGSPQADTVAQLNTLRSEIAQNVMQMYRDMSKTGGAVGSVSDAEQRMFQDNLAALSRAQSPEQMRSSLQRVMNFVDQSQGRLRTAFDAQYGAGAFDGYMKGNLTMGNNPVSPVPPVKPVPPKVGDVLDGWKFLGGDPSSQQSWQRIGG